MTSYFCVSISLSLPQPRQWLPPCLPVPSHLSPFIPPVPLSAPPFVPLSPSFPTHPLTPSLPGPPPPLPCPRSVPLPPLCLCPPGSLCPFLYPSICPPLPLLLPLLHPCISLSPTPVSLFLQGLSLSLCHFVTPSSLPFVPPSSLLLSQPCLGYHHHPQPSLWLLMSRGAFEVARAGVGELPKGAGGGSCCQGPNEAPSEPFPPRS